MLLKGYGADQRIVHGTGRIVAQAEPAAEVAALFDDPRVQDGHVRPATHTCHTCRIDPP